MSACLRIITLLFAFFSTHSFPQSGEDVSNANITALSTEVISPQNSTALSTEVISPQNSTDDPGDSYDWLNNFVDMRMINGYVNWYNALSYMAETCQSALTPGTSFCPDEPFFAMAYKEHREVA